MTKMPETAFDNLLAEMANLFELEFKERGDLDASETAKALRAAINTVQPAQAKPYAYDDLVDQALKSAGHPCAVAAKNAATFVQWENTAGILDDFIPDDVAIAFAGNSIMGPGCLIDHPTLRCGLYFQRANAYYALHSHEAVETYIMIEGVGDWTQGEVTTRYGVEGIIHHTSYMPHAFRTFDQPLLAIWRWSGNIDPTTYKMLPDKHR